jgi:hypothetical protein
MAQTLDTDHSGEVTAILAEATLVVEEEFHHAHHRDAIILGQRGPWPAEGMGADAGHGLAAI